MIEAIVATVVSIALVLTIIAVAAAKDAKRRERLHAQINKHRTRARAWLVAEWLFGNTRQKRLTDERQNDDREP